MLIFSVDECAKIILPDNDEPHALLKLFHAQISFNDNI